MISKTLWNINIKPLSIKFEKFYSDDFPLIYSYWDKPCRLYASYFYTPQIFLQENFKFNLPLFAVKDLSLRDSWGDPWSQPFVLQGQRL